MIQRIRLIWVRFFAILASSAKFTSSNPFDAGRDGVSVHKYWRCSFCYDDKFDHKYLTMTIYGQIHTAVRHGERLSYLPLDMSWIDRLEQVDAKVHVSYYDFKYINKITAPTVITESDNTNNKRSLRDTRMDEKGDGMSDVESKLHSNNGIKWALDENSLNNVDGKTISRKTMKLKRSTNEELIETVSQPLGLTVVTEFDEEFQVLAFHFETFVSQLPPKSGLAYSQKAYHTAIDTFLSLNPCWVILQEPPTPSAALFATTRESFSNAANQQHQYKLKEQVVHSHPLLLFIRLPLYSYYATCKLYTAIVKRQFPSKCEYDKAKIAKYLLANIGFGHVSIFTTNAFASVFRFDEYKKNIVFTAPKAQNFLSRPNKTAQAILTRVGGNGIDALQGVCYICRRVLRYNCCICKRVLK